MWEAIMLICFGASWPPAIIKTLKVKNPKGKSFIFLSLVTFGYFCGIVGKITKDGCCALNNPVFWLYVADFVMVATDFLFSVYYTIKRKNMDLD